MPLKANYNPTQTDLILNEGKAFIDAQLNRVERMREANAMQEIDMAYRNLQGSFAKRAQEAGDDFDYGTEIANFNEDVKNVIGGFEKLLSPSKRALLHHKIDSSLNQMYMRGMEETKNQEIRKAKSILGKKELELYEASQSDSPEEYQAALNSYDETIESYHKNGLITDSEYASHLKSMEHRNDQFRSDGYELALSQIEATQGADEALEFSEGFTKTDTFKRMSAKDKTRIFKDIKRLKRESDSFNTAQSSYLAKSKENYNTAIDNTLSGTIDIKTLDNAWSKRAIDLRKAIEVKKGKEKEKAIHNYKMHVYQRAALALRFKAPEKFATGTNEEVVQAIAGDKAYVEGDTSKYYRRPASGNFIKKEDLTEEGLNILTAVSNLKKQFNNFKTPEDFEKLIEANKAMYTISDQEGKAMFSRDMNLIEVQPSKAVSTFVGELQGRSKIMLGNRNTMAQLANVLSSVQSLRHVMGQTNVISKTQKEQLLKVGQSLVKNLDGDGFMKYVTFLKSQGISPKDVFNEGIVKGRQSYDRNVPEVIGAADIAGDHVSNLVSLGYRALMDPQADKGMFTRIQAKIRPWLKTKEHLLKGISGGADTVAKLLLFTAAGAALQEQKAELVGDKAEMDMNQLIQYLPSLQKAILDIEDKFTDVGDKVMYSKDYALRNERNEIVGTSKPHEDIARALDSGYRNIPFRKDIGIFHDKPIEPNETEKGIFKGIVSLISLKTSAGLQNLEQIRDGIRIVDKNIQYKDARTNQWHVLKNADGSNYELNFRDYKGNAYELMRGNLSPAEEIEFKKFYDNEFLDTAMSDYDKGHQASIGLELAGKEAIEGKKSLIKGIKAQRDANFVELNTKELEFGFESNYDGDTVTGTITHPTLGKSPFTIRIVNVDTPEMKGSRAQEAKKAQKRVNEILSTAEKLIVTTPVKGYYGRGVADIIVTHDGKDRKLSEIITSEGLGVVYSVE